MDTTFRVIVKGLTWQAMGILTMTLLSYPHTETLLDAFFIASSAAASGFIFFFIHENIWNKVRWGRMGQSK